MSASLLSQSLEAFQTCTVNGRLVVVSVLDDFEVGDQSDFGDDFRTQDVLLYAENLLLSSALRMKNGVVSAHALTLTGDDPAFDVAGEPGESPSTPNQDPNSAGTAGSPGSPGGTLSLYLETSSDTSWSLGLGASGGNGGDGQMGTDKTAGGDGGAAGAGGTVVAVVGVEALNWLDTLRSVYKLDERGAQNEALRELATQIKDASGPPSLITEIDDAVAASDAQFSAKLEVVALQLQEMGSGVRSDVLVACDVTAGNPGTYGAGTTNGKTGASAQKGQKSCVTFGTPSDLSEGSWSTFALVHPSQCSRLLEKIKLMYWTLDPVANPSGVGDLMALMLRLQARTALFAEADDSSALVEFYNEHESEIGAFGSVAELVSVHQQVTNLLAQVKQGQDLFGYDAAYVPLASLEFYRDVLDSLLEDFEVLEQAYESYFSAVEAQEKNSAAIRATRNAQDQVISQATSENATLKSYVLQTATVIDSYQTILPGLLDNVNSAIDALDTKMQDHFDFNWDNVFSSMQTLAFAPESKFMMLTEGAQFMYDGTTNVTNDQGVPVDKSYVVSQVKAVEGSIDSVSEGYSAMDDGELQCDDPGAGKLVTEEQQFDAVMDQFYSSFPSEIDAVKQAVDAYLTQIQARNNQILNYNAAVVKMESNAQAISDATAQKQVVNQDAIETLDPTLPSMLSYVSGVYYSAREQVMRTLDLTARAYKFWALSDSDLISTAYGGNTLPTINYSTLVAASTTILEAYSQAVEGFGTNSSSFPAQSSQNQFIVEANELQVQLFQELGGAMLDVAPATPSTTRTESPFADMANVRVNKVRAWVDGAKTTNGTLRLRITHTGRETIVNTTGESYAFDHSPVDKLFEFDIATGEVLLEADFGVENTSSGSSNTYAALGPFTSWYVQAKADDNIGLDLSEVTGLRLEFHGTSFAF